MQKRLSWLSKPLKDRIWVDREHAPLPRIAGEEDPRLDLEHLFKVGDGIPLGISVVDEELEDVAVVDGAVDVKEEHRRKIDLASNAIHVASMDIIQVNVHEQPALPAVMQQLRASTSEVISHKHAEDRVEHVEDQEETDEVMVARRARFSGLQVVYDAEGYEYQVDEDGNLVLDFEDHTTTSQQNDKNSEN